MRNRRLPLGGETSDATEYSDAWTQLARPLCDAFGWDIRGFDPDFSFLSADRQRVFSLSVLEVLTIRERLGKVPT